MDNPFADYFSSFSPEERAQHARMMALNTRLLEAFDGGVIHSVGTPPDFVVTFNEGHDTPENRQMVESIKQSHVTDN